MKTIDLTFFGLVKNYTVKDRTTLSLGSLNIGERTCRRRFIPSICYPPQARQKQRGTVNHDGENEGTGLGFVSKYLLIDGSCQLLLLNMAIVCVESVGWGIHLSLRVTATIWVITLLWVIQRIPQSSSYYGWVFVSSSSQVLLGHCVVPSKMFKGSQPRVVYQIVSVLYHLYHTSFCNYCFVSLMGETSWPSLDESLPVDANTSSRKKI